MAGRVVAIRRAGRAHVLLAGASQRRAAAPGTPDRPAAERGADYSWSGRIVPSESRTRQEPDPPGAPVRGYIIHGAVGRLQGLASSLLWAAHDCGWHTHRQSPP